MSDTEKGRELKNDGIYYRRSLNGNEEKICSQELLYEESYKAASAKKED